MCADPSLAAYMIDIALGNSLIAEQRCTHAPYNDVDCNSKRDEEAGGDGVHASKVRHSSRSTQNQHRRDDGICGQPGDT